MLFSLLHLPSALLILSGSSSGGKTELKKFLHVTVQGELAVLSTKGRAIIFMKILHPWSCEEATRLLWVTSVRVAPCLQAQRRLW